MADTLPYISILANFACCVTDRLRLLSYSTVTDFARLRGWSTSVPMTTAVW